MFNKLRRHFDEEEKTMEKENKIKEETKKRKVAERLRRS